MRLLIVNPYATGVSERRVDEVARVLGDVEVRQTERRGHATELARDAQGAEAVYVFSGDGGFNEVLNGIDAETPVGILPGGGANVLARALGLPRDPVRAAERVVLDRPAESRSAGSTGADSGSRRGSASTPRRSAASRLADEPRSTAERATSSSHGSSHACLPSAAAASSPRWRSRVTAARPSRSWRTQTHTPMRAPSRSASRPKPASSSASTSSRRAS